MTYVKIELFEIELFDCLTVLVGKLFCSTTYQPLSTQFKCENRPISSNSIYHKYTV